MKTDFLHDKVRGFSLMLQYDLSDGYLKWTFSFWNPTDVWNPKFAKEICQKRADIPNNRYAYTMFLRNGTRITDLKKELLKFCNDRNRQRFVPNANRKDCRRNHHQETITLVNYILSKYEDVA